MTFITALNQSILDRHLAAHEYWKASQMLYRKARMINYIYICSRSQKIQISRYWVFTESPRHLFMITHSTLRDILTFLIFVFDISPKSTPIPQGSYPNPAQTHILGPCLWNPSDFVSVPSASKSLIEIEAPMARHSAGQSHDNSGSLGCWMLIEANKQISVTWIGHHFQGVQIWVLRRLACYGVGLQGRGNESPVQVAPRELRDGFSSAPRSPLHSHF